MTKKQTYFNEILVCLFIYLGTHSVTQWSFGILMETVQTDNWKQHGLSSKLEVATLLQAETQTHIRVMSIHYMTNSKSRT